MESEGSMRAQRVSFGLVAMLDGSQRWSVLSSPFSSPHLSSAVSLSYFETVLTLINTVNLAGINSANYLREQYLAAVLVQDQAFFDRVGPGEIITRANKDIDSIRTGLGERLGYLIWSASTIITVSLSHDLS